MIFFLEKWRRFTGAMPTGCFCETKEKSLRSLNGWRKEKKKDPKNNIFFAFIKMFFILVE